MKKKNKPESLWQHTCCLENMSFYHLLQLPLKTIFITDYARVIEKVICVLVLTNFKAPSFA